MPRISLSDRRVLVPDAILPEQFDQMWWRRITPPEVALMLALLEQAVGDLRPSRIVRGNRSAQRLYREAYAWVDSVDRSHPFSFVNVCEAVGLSAEGLRERLLGDSERLEFNLVAPPNRQKGIPDVNPSTVAEEDPFPAGAPAAHESAA